VVRSRSDVPHHRRAVTTASPIPRTGAALAPPTRRWCRKSVHRRHGRGCRLVRTVLRPPRR